MSTPEPPQNSKPCEISEVPYGFVTNNDCEPTVGDIFETLRRAADREQRIKIYGRP